MPKSRNQKLKILYIRDYLLSHTDENTGVTVGEIIDRLASLDITAERKSVYEDIAQLTDVYGDDIMVCRNGKRHEYRMMSREFETPELRLLTDAVQASKFVTQKKSSQLISKLKTLAGPTATLTGEVVVSGRIKSMEETIYYNVDIINTAIANNSMIEFNYFAWTPKKEKALRRDGARYLVSPLSLCWADENYYLIANEEGGIRHFRVDKMLDITELDTPRESPDGFDPAAYGGRVFGMFGGREEKVSFNCKNHLAGAIIDRFGKDIMLIPHGDTFNFTATVKISPQFFGWVCGFGNEIKITSPQSVKDEFIATLSAISEEYNEKKDN